MTDKTKPAPAAGTDGAGGLEPRYRGLINVTEIDPVTGDIKMYPLGPVFELTAGQVYGTEDLFIGRLHCVQVAVKSLDDLDVVRQITEISP